MKNLILLGVILLMTNCIQVAKTTDHNPDLDFIEVDNYKFHVKTSGNENKPPVIVIHGGPGADFKYLLELERLADDYHVLFYDQRMTGLSPRQSSLEPGPEQDLRDLHKLINKFAGAEKVKLIGHSYGAMLATGYISRHPDKVSHAVIIEPGILTPQTAKEFVKKFKESSTFLSKLKMAVPVSKSIFLSLFISNTDGDERMDYIFSKIMAAGSGGKPYLCEGTNMPENSFTRPGYTVMKKTVMPMMDRPEFFDVELVNGLNKFKGNVLMLSSSCSFIGYDYQEQFHRKYFPKKTVHQKLQNSGHNFLTMQADVSIPILRDFLRK